MNAIVAVCDDWAIGRKGQLLVRNKADMARFVRLTTGGTVVMGRKTYESFPKGPLRGRRNIIVTQQAGYLPPKAQDLPANTTVELAPSPAEALAAAAAEPDRPVWLIGGESLYRALLPQVDQVFVTANHTHVEGADAFFPNLDQDPAWQVVAKEEGGTTRDGVAFDFLTYTRR